MPQLGNGGSQEGAQSNGNANNPGNKQSRKSHSKSTNSFGGDSSRFGKHDPHPGIGPGPSGVGGSLTPGMTRMGLPTEMSVIARALRSTQNPKHPGLMARNMEVGFFDDAKRNGFVDAAARRAVGMVPGVDTTTTVSRVTGKAPNTKASFSPVGGVMDAVGLGLGVPGLGALASALSAPTVETGQTQFEKQSMARALTGKPGGKRPPIAG